MLLPEELTKYSDELAELFEQLEAFILADMSAKLARRLLVHSKTPVLEPLSVVSMDMKNIAMEVEATKKKAIETVTSAYHEAHIKSFERERVILEVGGKKLAMGAAKKRIIDNSIKDATKQILNFTGSIGMAGLPLERAYHNALNTAYLQVAFGASGYVSAVKRQTRNLADYGLEFISYESGHVNRADVAIRRAVITGLKQTTNQISEINAAEMNCDGYETSAHSGARPSHQFWQGRQFAIYDRNLGYPLYSEVVGSQMDEPNCRHSRWGIFLGLTKPVLTIQQIMALDAPPFMFSVDSKMYNSYEATQKQRSIERAIRKSKRRVNAYESAGLYDDARAEKEKAKQQYSLYKQFSKEAGLLEQRERLGIVPGRAKVNSKTLRASSKDANGQRQNAKYLIEIIEKPDYNNIISTLQKYEKQIVKQDFETAVVVTKTGEVFRIDGNAANVNPTVIGNKIIGSYVTHNHPDRETEFSFSKDDHSFFISSELVLLRGVDYKYTYELVRKPFVNLYDTDIPLSEIGEDDYRHIVSAQTAKERGYYYERRKNKE